MRLPHCLFWGGPAWILTERGQSVSVRRSDPPENREPEENQFTTGRDKPALYGPTQKLPPIYTQPLISSSGLDCLSSWKEAIGSKKNTLHYHLKYIVWLHRGFHLYSLWQMSMTTRRWISLYVSIRPISFLTLDIFFPPSRAISFFSSSELSHHCLFEVCVGLYCTAIQQCLFIVIFEIFRCKRWSLLSDCECALAACAVRRVRTSHLLLKWHCSAPAAAVQIFLSSFFSRVGMEESLWPCAGEKCWPVRIDPNYGLLNPTLRTP